MLVAWYLPPRTIGFCLKRLKVPSYFPLTQYSRFPTKSRNPLRPTTKHLQFQANPLAQIRSSDLTGKHLGTFTSGGQLDGPGGLSLGPEGHIYVVSFNNHKLLRFGKDGSPQPGPALV